MNKLVFRFIVISVITGQTVYNGPKGHMKRLIDIPEFSAISLLLKMWDQLEEGWSQ